MEIGGAGFMWRRLRKENFSGGLFDRKYTRFHLGSRSFWFTGVSCLL